MGVKRLLAKQTHGFISLHDVLTQMMEIDGATYQQAAEALYRQFWQEYEQGSPEWCKTDLGYGLLSADLHAADNILVSAIEGPPTSADELRKFQSVGFRASEIYQFLRKHGIELKEAHLEGATQQTMSLNPLALQAEIQKLQDELALMTQARDVLPAGDRAEIRGPTFAKLQRVIAEYPSQYVGKTPKLDADVRPWIKATVSCNERELAVFGAIIAEHFGLTVKRR
jgi:hypothetical protein